MVRHAGLSLKLLGIGKIQRGGVRKVVWPPSVMTIRIPERQVCSENRQCWIVIFFFRPSVGFSVLWVFMQH